MKLKLGLWKITYTFLIAIVIVAAALFGIFFSVFVTPEKWSTWQPYTIIGVWLILSIVFYILSITQNYYLVSKSEVVQVRMFRKTTYKLDNIIYIDKAVSEKRKMVCFFTREGYKKYLTFDKDGKIYSIMLKECKSLISEEDFHLSYPNVKF
ncbi:MAG: hypothetical protein LUC16_02565 [Coprobacillus sp.]|nr:hypothetical protein [Coprobacillus sp.]